MAAECELPPARLLTVNFNLEAHTTNIVHGAHSHQVPKGPKNNNGNMINSYCVVRSPLSKLEGYAIIQSCPSVKYEGSAVVCHEHKNDGCSSYVDPACERGP